MAKAFSEEEKIKIQKDMKIVGEEIFSKFGLKKTKIGDITEAVGIGKGSFYAFYPSKEMLFLDILGNIGKELKIKIKDYIDNELKIEKGEIYKIFKIIFDFWFSRPLWIKFFSESENLYALKRKLPKDFMKGHIEEEKGLFFDLLNFLKDKGLLKENIDYGLALGILKSINLTCLNRELIGEDIIYEVIDLKMRMFAIWLEKEDLK
jgi:AcrR family transcriptional regulator